MALNQNRRLSIADRQADQDALLALRDLKDYQAVNPAYKLEALDALEAALNQAQQEEKRIETALKAARDATTAAAWALHNALLGVKSQVIAQYGPDSNEVQALGLKKKSERRRPARRNGSTALKPGAVITEEPRG